jgi:RND family efflux transporter MFP subunit
VEVAQGFELPILLLILAMLVGACGREPDLAAPEIRPVRTITVEKRSASTPVTLTGRIEAVNEAALGFRIAGRVIENNLKLGQRVAPGEVLARLDPRDELNALRSARANLAAAQGQLTRARAHFERQKFLLERDVVSRAVFDDAKQRLTTAQSQVDATEAQFKVAKDLVSFTDLKADASGLVTAIGQRAGEFVQPGQMIVRLAREAGRDAVFDVAAQLIRLVPADPEVTVSLTDDPSVAAHGRVREVAPQADPVTRTFKVKVGLIDPPPAMRLGATVAGSMWPDAVAGIEIPATALITSDEQPAVWIVDPSTLTVSLRKIEVQQRGLATVAVSHGLKPGEIVAVAGVRELRLGQQVRLLGSESS